MLSPSVALSVLLPEKPKSLRERNCLKLPRLHYGRSQMCVDCTRRVCYGQHYLLVHNFLNSLLIWSRQPVVLLLLDIYTWDNNYLFNKATINWRRAGSKIVLTDDHECLCYALPWGTVSRSPPWGCTTPPIAHAVQLAAPAHEPAPSTSPRPSPRRGVHDVPPLSTSSSENGSAHTIRALSEEKSSMCSEKK